MKKLSVKKLIEFRGKTPRGKRNFVENMKSTRIDPPSDGGGDYWVSCVSAVCNAYRYNDINFIDQKIDELRGKADDTAVTITKNMYGRNIENLRHYKVMPYKKWRPSGKLEFLKRKGTNPVLVVKGLEIEVKASLVFRFGNEDEPKVGAIWFFAKKDGFRIEEVGMFCEMLYRFLRHNYARKYTLASQFCIAVDLFSSRAVRYSELESGAVPSALLPILDEISRMV